MIIQIRTAAVKDIKKISEPHKTLIKNRIKQLTNYPNISNIKKLTNFTPGYRLRIGRYRVLFDIDFKRETIFIGRILHRKDSY